MGEPQEFSAELQRVVTGNLGQGSGGTVVIIAIDDDAACSLATESVESVEAVDDRDGQDPEYCLCV